MEINTKLQNALKAFGTIVLIVLAALPLYYNREKTTSLEIKKISEVVANSLKSFLEILYTRPFQLDNSHIILPLGLPSKMHI